MKHITILAMIVLFANFTEAQNSDYDSLWKSVEKLENEGLPKSALDIVLQISTKAKQGNNQPQVIKALLYKSKYALTLEENAQLQIIADFKKEIAQSESPTKHVLQNMLATMYWQYFQQNRWQFYNRTKTAEKVDETDFRTWDLETLFTEIQTQYNLSLENVLMLQQTPISDFDAIIYSQSNSKQFRPTLYDLLANTALNFYKTDENSISQPAYKFEINNPKFSCPAVEFSQAEITSIDSTSLQLQALKTYQKLIQFHLKNNNTKALVDIDIARLKFVKDHATFSNKETVFLETLKESRANYTSEESALYAFEIAQLYFEQGGHYEPKTAPELQWKIKEAYDLCATVIKNFPKSIAAKKCAVVQKLIELQSLQVRAERYSPIQQDGRMLVTYKNLKSLDLKAYKLNENEFEAFSKIYRDDEQLAFVKKLSVAKSWQATLKNEGDYQQHQTEILLPAMENGRFLIVASAKNEANTFAIQTLQITNIALVDKTENDKQTYQFINRTNGQPILNLTVKIAYKENYNGDFKHKTVKSDLDGNVEISKTQSRWTQVKIEVNSKTEKAYFGDYYINPEYKQNEDPISYKGFLFTDRSIYRPGQTVYFKGISIKTTDGKSEVLANEETDAILYNVNGEEVSRLTLKTNAYGSISGEFILPNTGLTGGFRIQLLGKSHHLGNASTYFSVEEYKRPKFETTFKPITETFKINDSITVKGTALAFAGSNITNAKVVYRVHRKVQYPDWYYWYRPASFSEPQEITHGESTTNDKGEFEIIFKAIPDSNIDKNTLPIFNYEVTADVTDINGETRSSSVIVNVGYHAMTASISVESTLDKTTKNHSIEIDTRNLNGEFTPATGTLKIYKLQAPEQVLRNRPWEAPDYKMLSEAEFKAKFPYDAYANEDNPNNWKKGDMVFETDFNTEKSKTISLKNIKKWDSGLYVIVLESTDKFGQAVTAEAKTNLYSDKDKTVSDNQLFRITTNKNTYQPNDTVLLTMGSAAENIIVTIDIEKDKKTISSYILNLNNNKKTIEIPVTEADFGGFAVNYSFAFSNSFQSGTEIISVPYPKTDLEIETTTFRDKLQPGTDETWAFKIKGPQGEKVSAEILASMYDTSLDQFQPHNWTFYPLDKPMYNSNSTRQAHYSFGIQNFRTQNTPRLNLGFPHQGYDQLNWFGFYFGDNSYFYEGELVMESSEVVVEKLQGKVSGIALNTSDSDSEGANRIVLRGNRSITGSNQALIVIDGVISSAETLANLPPDSITSTNVLKGAAGSALYGSEGANGVIVVNTKKEDFSKIQVRKNLQETAFFFPQLQTDEAGNVSFSFTTPEALTKWKLQLLAHTKTLESQSTSLETVTQKELMVIPNAPRFLRHGDAITISTKIANLTENTLSGQAQLQLTDAITGKAIDTILGNTNNTKSFEVDAKGNTQVSWLLNIPETVNAVQYKVVAKAGTFSDGEQNAMPVLSNRLLVTETLPMWIKSNETRTFTLDKLKKNTSSSLKHHKLTLEMTSNPAWYAVQALPYLMEYPYDCNEQTFSRYYANALASHIANSNPRIQEVFNQWRNSDALVSNLEKNPELKNILIQETPWLRDAQSETEQKKRIALLFDLNKMTSELQNALGKLEQNQMTSGAWPWFKGGRENRFITQHIITGFGHLDKLNVIQSASEESMISNAISYLDNEFIKEYKNITKYTKNVDLSKDHLSYTQLHYLYMRSFFPDVKRSKEVQDISEYYLGQIDTYWLSRSIYSKGLMTLISHRMNNAKTAGKILKSLKETSITNDELGMYWKDNTASWHWYQAPIETQALLIEAFQEVGSNIYSATNNTHDIDNLKMWLLKNKQTNKWESTKATSDAVYALLLQGSDWLSVTEAVTVLVGNKKIDPSKLEAVKVEAGTGYYKTSWNASEIKPEMADVTLTKTGKGIAWGSLYWQYFEDLDKITTAKTPLQLKKKLFKKTNTDSGEVISEITSETALQVGDLVRVRIELQSDRDMEFIHMKDMRAAGLEPINVLSTYKWQDGLGYYESTKDASTNFFFDYLPKGIYVFEYDLRVNNAGNMSNGITTIQSMYAPEFSSHSEGVRISVD
ncbi:MULTISPECIES: alpha-2-macroglobulin family protein [Bizionia]|uniref:TonB-dependent receptor plug domain-containing protein n=1 Tax=Bizionia algoritergicola TaxID=291187 RepID=A0A5D0QVS2_9FLAO|nr:MULTISPECIES: MG2 domain-containing protein [Bizionia]OBX22674.1 alpha-2-macroglobulin [Bizionia sp. APA-3]TYB72896.1 TonB-dependent receptor plug domain-containing protein [Bizionia algoritergicola]